MDCKACNSSDCKIIFVEFGIAMYKCKRCGHMFSSYAADRYYEGYFGDDVSGNDHFWWDEAHQKMYNDFCEKYVIGKKGRLFDVGCGLGFFLRKINNYPNWQTYGYEISKTASDFAKDKLKLKNISCGKVEEAGFPRDYFDIITLWDVIEHIPDPDRILSYIHSILKKDGILFIHTPNANIQLFKARLKKLIYGMKPGVHYLEAKDHVNIYTTRSIFIVLRRNNFPTAQFIHLHPIQSVSGSKSGLYAFIKNLWFHFSAVLYRLSLKKINLNNLHIVVRK